MVVNIQAQDEIKNHIVKHYDNFKKKGQANMTVELARTRMKRLDSLWQTYINNDEIIRNSDDVDLADQYFQDNDLFGMQEVYDDVMDLYVQFLKVSEPAPQQQPTQVPVDVQAATVTGNQAGISSLLKSLPQITLPTFSGNSTEWPHFRDMFASLIHSQSVPAVVKLNYLHAQLKDEALAVIKNIPISGANYELSWDTLKLFYENERRLVNHHLHDLFSVQPMASETYSETKRILSESFAPFDALTALGRPTKHWSDMIVYLIVNNMHKNTRRDWEKSLGQSTKAPTLERVKSFLTSQSLVYESVEQNSKKSISSSQPKKTSSTTSMQVSTDTQTKDNGKKKDKSNRKCPLCNEEHYISKCLKFQEKTIQERRAFVNKNKLCFNCLGFHQLNTCRSKFSCSHCKGKHHSLLHSSEKTNKGSNLAPQVSKPDQQVQNGQLTSVQNLSSQASTSKQDTNYNQDFFGSTSLNCASQFGDFRVGVLLGTAKIIVEGPDGRKIHARALIDNCSQPSFISDNLSKKLNLPITSTNAAVSAVGGNQAVSSKKLVKFKIRPHFSSRFSCEVKALVVPRVCNYTPPRTEKISELLYLSHLNLADPAFLDKTEIDVLLGADIHATIVQEGIIRGKPNEPIAMASLLGWLISGSIPLSSHVANSVSLHCAQNDALSDILQNFWRQEELPSTKFLSPADEICEEHFLKTVKRNEEGRYVLKLPFKNPEDIQLGDSYQKAVIMLKRMEQKFQADPVFKELYFDFIREYIASGHMIPAPPDFLLHDANKSAFFLPHHGILKPSSSTTKLRTVFNGSSKTSNGLSLNEQLLTGPNLLPELPDLVCAWRLYKYVFVADIKQMFRQIRIDDSDLQYQAIVWRYSPDDPIRIYLLTTVTFGLVCSPYQATRTLRQLASDYQSVYPMATGIINSETYMDDMLSGGHSLEQTLDKQSQLIGMLKEGGFELRKWLSNNPEVLSNLPGDHLALDPSIIFEASSSFAVLGLNWQARDDLFSFKVNYTPIEGNISKRAVLSKLAQIFDPLGWIAPVTISAKIFMQSLWLLKCSWDTPLPSEYVQQWEDWSSSLSSLNSLEIPRFIHYSPESFHIEIHGFADASQKAYASVIYLRVIGKEGVNCSLQLAKTKVAPLKSLSIPRLELLGAHTLAKLTSHYLQFVPIKVDSVHLWSDSKDVLFWLRSHPARWQTFVANRCSDILTLLPSAYWHHVKSKDNPADVASRGIEPDLFPKHPLWWRGPSWLESSSEPWPTTLENLLDHEPIEERPVKIGLVANAASHVENSQKLRWDITLRFGSLSRLIRVSAYVFRFVVKFVRKMIKKNPVHSKFKFLKFLDFSNIDSPYLSTTELRNSKLFWIYQIQQINFSLEIKILQNPQFKAINKIKGALSKLSPFFKDYFLRVGGRLDQALLPYDNKHPFILPGDCFFSHLLIRQAHAKTLHGGVQLSLATVRQEFWLIKGRQAVKNVLRNCNVCVRYAAKISNPFMGDLPNFRVSNAPPFSRSGVDYAGPYSVRLTKTRGVGTMKSWVCLFVCLATRGIHLELVEDYSAEAFIAAFHRFTSRWGHCTELVSDQGRNFTGADRELRSMFRKSSKFFNQICPYLAQQGTKWLWNPPGAPHFGGIWESGVKSTKYHLRRVLGESILTYSEMTTLLSRIGACLNSRPLLPLSDDISDINYLTPAHFLIQRKSYLIPEPDFTDDNIPAARRWQLISQKTQHFWSRWRKEYLSSLQPRNKWQKVTRSFQVGDVVYIRNDDTPPGHWPIARVVKTYPDKHGVNRVCDLSAGKKVYQRPSVKLVLLLPVENEQPTTVSHFETTSSNLVLLQAAK